MLVLVVAAWACDRGDSSGGRNRCTEIPIAASPDKFDLLSGLAVDFNGSARAPLIGGCAAIRVLKVTSGVAMQRLADGWPDEGDNLPRPAVWTPSASTWGAILSHRLSESGRPPMTGVGKPLWLTPLVIAMPRPMAQALGWPGTPIGYRDILRLAQDPAGWGAKGHGEWGPFRLGKTNPNFSTSALSSTIAQYYAATGKTTGLNSEDLDRREVGEFARGVESSVVHYGDITLTFLNNWYRNDARGSALTYASALAVEEKSVIEYNRGNPDGILDPGEEPRPPRIPLVAIYPKEGTLYSDHPFFVLDAPWVTPVQKDVARRFEAFVQQPDSQQRALTAGFRPGNPQVGVGPPVDRANGVDPGEPQNVLGVPEPQVLVRIIELWNEQRKGAKVMLLIDVSGSMGDTLVVGNTKLDLAKEAAVASLSQFKADDLVALRVFSTDISRSAPTDYVDLVPFGPVSSQRETIIQKIRGLSPSSGTPLYTATRDSYTQLRDTYDRSRINAVVLLSDGKNDDHNDDLDGLVATLRAGSEGQASRPVRIFPIAYGKDADRATLNRIAEATNAAAYNASDPKSIDKVFMSVISNF